MECGLTTGSEHQCDHLPAVSTFPLLQVNFKYRRYWSGNVVQDGNKLVPEVRFCPECHDFIEHDERGYPVCLTCGSIFPLPPKIGPSDIAKAEKHKNANMRKFINKVRADDSYISEIRDHPKAKHTKGTHKRKRHKNGY